MLGIANYSTFVISFIIVLMIPGVGNLALITSTSKGGIKGGLMSSIGMILGDQILLWLALAGLAALLQAYPTALSVIQWLGAIYLLYLGGRMFFSRNKGDTLLDIKSRQYLKQTLLITVLNPKAIIFYMAFLPLFIQPKISLGFITYSFIAINVAILTFIYGVIVVNLTYWFSEKIKRNTRLSHYLEKIASICLIGFGLRLIMN